MAELHLQKRILAWGNSYGIRLTRKELHQLAREGEEVEVIVRPVRRAIDWSKIGGFNLGPDLSLDHDAVIGRGVWEDYQESRRRESEGTPRDQPR